MYFFVFVVAYSFNFPFVRSKKKEFFIHLHSKFCWLLHQVENESRFRLNAWTLSQLLYSSQQHQLKLRSEHKRKQLFIEQQQQPIHRRRLFRRWRGWTRRRRRKWIRRKWWSWRFSNQRNPFRSPTLNSGRNIDQGSDSPHLNLY